MSQDKPAKRDRSHARERGLLEREGVPYRLLVDSVRDYAIFMLDVQGRIASWNQGAERLKGYSAEEVIGHNYSMFYAPEEIAAGLPEKHLQRALTTGHSEHQGWRVRKDGTRFWADVAMNSLRGRAGEIVGFVKITRDLTARRKAEDQLRESEERFRLLVESVKDYAIFMLDTEGHIISWNAGAERIKGYSAEEIIGKHFSIFYPPEDVANGKPAWELEEAIKLGRIEDEGWRVRKDGSRFFADVIITAVRDEKGELRGFAKVTRDMTERRAAEAERHALLQARIRSEETNRAKDEFLMTLSHELRTPMTSILGWSRLLVSGVLGPEEQKTAIQAIEQSATAQATLIDDVLDVSRLIAGKLRLKMEAVDPGQVASEAVLTLKPMADARQVKLVTEIDNKLGLVAADRDRLRQIIWNLVSNAVKFSREGQQVTVSLMQKDSDMEIAVKDEGEGIAPEFVPFVFEPFMQADSSATRKHGGLGLGLTIVRNLVELHGGTARAQSAGRGQGATFRVTIPIGAVIDRSDASGKLVLESVDSTIAGAHVLFVDDHAPSRALVTSILQHAGSRVDCVSSVDEALARLRDFSPDLIITDIAMPERDGFELLRAVREHPDQNIREIPIVAFTAFGRNEGRTGFDAWLKKPIEPEDLVSAVASAIGKS